MPEDALLRMCSMASAISVVLKRVERRFALLTQGKRESSREASFDYVHMKQLSRFLSYRVRPWHHPNDPHLVDNYPWFDVTVLNFLITFSIGTRRQELSG